MVTLWISFTGAIDAVYAMSEHQTLVALCFVSLLEGWQSTCAMHETAQGH